MISRDRRIGETINDRFVLYRFRTYTHSKGHQVLETDNNGNGIVQTDHEGNPFFVYYNGMTMTKQEIIDSIELMRKGKSIYIIGRNGNKSTRISDVAW